MYAKIDGGAVVKFPYSFGDLRKDNPNVSFPKNITQSISQRYGMQSVFTVDDPTYDPTTQKIVEATTPTRETNGVYTEEDAPLPEMIGEPIYTGRWVLEKTVVDMTADEIAELDDKAAEAVRKERDEKLAATDWRVIKAYETGSNIPAEWELYRQSLRDITTQEGFPHTVTWPEEPVA